YHLSVAAAEWSEEEGALGVFACLGYAASTDGAAVTARLALTNGVVMEAACTNFASGVYAAVFEGADKWLFEGARVTVTASNPGGGAFETWREATCGVSEEMPDMPIAEDFMRVATMTVVFPRVRLTVLEGAGSGRYRPGETVTIATNLPPSQFVFSRWVGDTQTVANVTARLTTVTVTNDMTVRAVYQAALPPTPQNFMVVNLTAGGILFETSNVATAPVGSSPYYNYRQGQMVLRRVVPELVDDWHPLMWYSGSSQRMIYTQFSSPFYISVFPVTQGQWYTLMGAYPPSTYTGLDYPYHPAEQVSYADIRGGAEWPQDQSSVDSGSFIGKMRTLTGRSFDLPTEGQWNRATLQNGLGGPSVQTEEDAGWTSKNSGGATHVVGIKPPGALGLFDMVGNVKEWCLDRSGNPGPNGAFIVDPVGATSGSQRIQRGGSYQTSISDTGNYGSSQFMRWGAAPSTKASDVGFRVALTYAEVSVTIDGTARTVPVGVAIPVAAGDQPGYRFTGWSVVTTAASLGDRFVTNAPNTLIVLPPGAGLTLTALYEPIPPPDPPYHDVTYEEAPVLVKGIKVGFAPGQVVLSWDTLQGEEVLGYAVEAKAALTDPAWDALFVEDGVTLAEDGAGGFSASIPDTLENADGMRYHFFQIRAVVETP
ncbi:MAG: SUMF1/EgtB/PvdO family nonheme iron enzyme, partial [Kiritimatiellaeota bacterium]|nr:SUMF1/EgtB/PvdO family nonheme iron enzyme [Kiritimatiellota bacterium]